MPVTLKLEDEMENRRNFIIGLSTVALLGGCQCAQSKSGVLGTSEI